jgi:hypothetical protein
MTSWFEFTVEGTESDLLICGEWEEVVTEWRAEAGIGMIPVATEVVFTDLEASRVLDDRWVDLPKAEAERLAEEHKDAIVEAATDAMLPSD